MSDEFTTRPERRAQQAQASFISDMRHRNPYAKVAWDEDTWEVGVGRRASARTVERLHFTRHASSSEGRGLGGGFNEPFASFVRATIVWRAINAKERPTALSQMVLVRAFRYLYEELLKDVSTSSGEVSPCRIKPSHFSSAAEAAAAREADQSAYRVANYLKYISSLIDRHGLTSVALRWSHGISRPESSGGLKQARVGKEFTKRRAKLLPTDEVLYAVSDISNAVDLSPPDALRQRLTDLLFCGGFRINEDLTLRRDALIEEEVIDDLGQPATDANGVPLPPYLGLRFLPEKKGETVTGIKWIPTDLVPIARRAFQELLELTAEFARDAEFAYLHPGRVRLGEPWDSMPGEAGLTAMQLVSMLGLSNKKSAMEWVGRYVTTKPGSKEDAICTKAEVEQALRDRMGPLEVLMGKTLVPLHEFVAVVPINFFHSKKPSLPGTATLVVDQNISDYLSGRGRGKGRTLSIFERRGSRLESGEPVRINTHQFRHFLDTVASSGGVSELVRARWMGRKYISQNSSYDHETGISLARKIRIRLVDGGMLGPIADVTRQMPDPVARGEAAEDLVRAVHKTMFGRCFHDWASSPCPEHEACWSCDEHLLIKGNLQEMEEADRQLAEASRAISAAESEMHEGTYGANNWLESHVRKRDRLRRILEVHRDETIPDGTIIHLGRDGNATPKAAQMELA